MAFCRAFVAVLGFVYVVAAADANADGPFSTVASGTSQVADVAMCGAMLPHDTPLIWQSNMTVQAFVDSISKIQLANARCVYTNFGADIYPVISISSAEILRDPAWSLLQGRLATTSVNWVCPSHYALDYPSLFLFSDRVYWGNTAVSVGDVWNVLRIIDRFKTNRASESLPIPVFDLPIVVALGETTDPGLLQKFLRVVSQSSSRRQIIFVCQQSVSSELNP